MRAHNLHKSSETTPKSLKKTSNVNSELSYLTYSNIEPKIRKNQDKEVVQLLVIAVASYGWVEFLIWVIS